MKALIVEDEPLSASHLKTLLHKVAPDVEVVNMLDSVKSAVNFLKEKPGIDLLFLDIHLADGLSFEIFQQIEIAQPVIFTTAYDEYAIKAFKVNSIDYLLKPIGLSDLKTAINKFKTQNAALNNANHNKHQMAFEMLSKSQKSRFIVKMGDNLSSIKTEEIAFFIAEDGIVILVTKEGKRFPIDYTMDALEAIISKEHFFRINRKLILNIDQILQVQSYFNGRLKIKLKIDFNDESIVSRERVTDFKMWLDQ
jgi:DNA-binding LytR/AlgR family response regulator